jgi:PTH2 family peptidyl-tRNA hydrolase
MKMVIVVRGELRLTTGKIAAQVAHAAVNLACQSEARAPAAFEAWSRGGQKKIVLTSPSLEDMMTLEREARARRIPTTWVEDAGLTEVPPGTRTCLGLGPAPTATLDAVTGKLDLL